MFFFIVVCLFIFLFCFALFLQKDHGYVPLAVVAMMIQSLFPLSSLSIGFSQDCSTTGKLVEQEVPIPPEHMASLLVFSRVRSTQFLVLYVMFCRSLFVVWPLYCLFSDLRLLITLSVSSTFCYDIIVHLFAGRILKFVNDCIISSLYCHGDNTLVIL